MSPSAPDVIDDILSLVWWVFQERCLCFNNFWVIIWPAMYFIPWLIPCMPCYVCLEACFKVLINATSPCLVKLAEACSATKMGFLSPPVLSRWLFALPPPVSAQVFLWPCSERSENWSQWKLTWFKKEMPGFQTAHFIGWLLWMSVRGSAGEAGAERAVGAGRRQMGLLLWSPSLEVWGSAVWICVSSIQVPASSWIVDLLTDPRNENTSASTKLLKKQLPLRISATPTNPCGIYSHCVVEITCAYALPSWWRNPL